MKQLDISWSFPSLDSWTDSVKTLVIVIDFTLVVIAGIYFDTFEQYETLQISKAKELELREEFEHKEKKAINIQNYQQQLKQVESSLEKIIKQMPLQEEIANLLIDISQTGLLCGLNFKLFKPNSPIIKGFYVELPISIQVLGSYNQLGFFISGLASLPRIVTVHDINITPESIDGTLLMSALVTTYYEAPELALIKKQQREQK